MSCISLDECFCRHVPHALAWHGCLLFAKALYAGKDPSERLSRRRAVHLRITITHLHDRNMSRLFAAFFFAFDSRHVHCIIAQRSAPRCGWPRYAWYHTDFEQKLWSSQSVLACLPDSRYGSRACASSLFKACSTSGHRRC